uniref:Uncharacterized protein n=1 Tax=Quercus lobata TaxID=97700 RepID=A0A7N2R132_QUELO
MFTNDRRQEERTGKYGSPRLQYLKELVSQFQNSTDEGIIHHNHIDDFLQPWKTVCAVWVLDLLAAWQGTFGRNGNIAFRRAVSHCITWCLRREQYARCFEGCEWSIIEI